ncbi:alpha/beta hydrolase [Micromonospora sp. DH14]|uniref:alpha/beta fold hydrolase n=1 Tax=Micromonospora sp. DH14 TaxID=3040120 RepID=UPI002443265B|nr:alpha/beta hydrolase [Micromonospora sp. DH14]MDG9675901.1 alpha/beta hydrolase [Micromonospora sp. DH14]
MNAASDKSAQEAGMPTVVLIHGAFADSSSWNGVIANLKRRGYPVIAVANPLRGVQKDAAYARAVVDSVSGPVVMAAHSYGGAVMTEAAEGAPNVKALVYVASLSPDVGESAADLITKFPGSALLTSVKMVPIPLDDGGTTMEQYVDQDQFPAVFAADVDPDTAELMAVTQRPATEAAQTESVTKVAWKTIPSWTLITTQDKGIPPDLQRFLAKRAGSTTVEIDASHAVAVSQPGPVADLSTQPPAPPSTSYPRQTSDARRRSHRCVLQPTASPRASQAASSPRAA